MPKLYIGFKKIIVLNTAWKAFEAPVGYMWSLITACMINNEKKIYILAYDVRKKWIL